MNNKIVKGGAEKARLKRSADLKTAANDPKQKKLSFKIIPTACAVVTGKC